MSNDFLEPTGGEGEQFEKVRAMTFLFQHKSRGIFNANLFLA